MFRCKECGKEFDDWHALGGHMRTHWGKRKTAEKGEVSARRIESGDRTRLAEALGVLSEMRPEEAWRIVVNWIVDMHSQLREKDELIQSYRMRLNESESRVRAVHGDLKKLQEALRTEGEPGN